MIKFAKTTRIFTMTCLVTYSPAVIVARVVSSLGRDRKPPLPPPRPAAIRHQTSIRLAAVSKDTFSVSMLAQKAGGQTHGLRQDHPARRDTMPPPAERHGGCVALWCPVGAARATIETQVGQRKQIHTVPAREWQAC